MAFAPDATTAFRIHGNSQTMAGNVDEMERQMHEIVNRFSSANPRLVKIARASVAINVCLARAVAGRPRYIWSALRNFIDLGPDNVATYLTNARLLERTLPRLRAWARGALA